MLRPTTRSPVLVHNPADADWFGAGPAAARARAGRPRRPPTPARCSWSPSTSCPQGLAILDAPDIDSVEERNRTLAAQLLAAADLWLFVTSAARYADQVPWDFLRQAAERSAAVAIVLDRTPPDAVETVATHLARMLAARGLKDSPLFTVARGRRSTSDGLLPADGGRRDPRLARRARPATPRPARRWCSRPSTARSASLTRRTHAVADAAAEQVDAADRLREDADAAYDEAIADDRRRRRPTAPCCAARCWRAGRSSSAPASCSSALETKVGWLRDRVVNAVKGKPQQAERVTVAVESGLETLILEHAEAAAERAEASWRTAGRRAAAARRRRRRPRPRLARLPPQRRARRCATGSTDVLDMVRTEGADKRTHRALPRLRRQRARRWR